ncbi:MAG: hypothetical protein KAV82_06230 [Phycisphaerae bacterium]|nr:hypothetical protein [Phycisphaerae bacterium]
MKHTVLLTNPLQAAGVTRLRVVLWVVSGLALVSLGLEYGFDEPPLPVAVLVAMQLVAVGVYLLSLVTDVVHASKRVGAVRRRWFDLLLILAGVVVLAVEMEVTSQPLLKVSTIYVVTLQVGLLVRLGVGLVQFNLALAEHRLHPGRLVVLSFLAVIVIGALLLALPKAVVPELRYEEGDYLLKHWLNCLFTSVSATCVTGLTVYDTGSSFTRFGQMVILVLIQLGGLGIMIFGGLFGILLRRQLSLRQSLALQDAMSHQTLGQVREMVKFVVVVTLVCEFVGAVVLYTMWPVSMGQSPERVFYSVFHAVSAFCNAGFSLQSDSLVAYRGAWQVYMGIMPLIVVGGLGFPVLHDLYHVLRLRLTPARLWRETDAIVLPRGRLRGTFHPFSLHTKLVLVSTVVLIVLPALGFFVFESLHRWGGDHRPPEVAALMSPAMGDLTPGERAAAAIFQSVTTRTAGFNTVGLDPDSFSTAGAFLAILLMFIGGSPASTAGGVKTVAIAIIALSVYSTLRGRANVEGFKRTIPPSVIQRAGVVVLLMFTLVGVVTLLLCLTERGESLLAVLFESVSACGTVGLSTGLTPRLTIAGRVIIMLGMFAGRIGPLTLLVALAGKVTPARYEYPHEQPLIG